MAQMGAEKYHGLEGIVRGVPKHSVQPIVDGIVSGLPRKARPALGVPTSAPSGSCATKIPSAAFGSGIFQEGAGPSRGESKKPEPAGTKKGMERKTARRAYE